MSSNIPTFYFNNYKSGIRQLPQQMTSRFRPFVMVDTAPEMQGELAFYDQLDATAMVPITDRHGKTQVTDDNEARRAISFTPYEKASMVDRIDEARVFNNPTNAYARSAVMAAMRTLDDVIIAAFFGSARTGKKGETLVPFPAANDVPVVAGGLTIDQLRDVNELMRAAENEKDNGENSWHGALSAKAAKNLLEQTEVTSSDYNTVRALTEGNVQSYMGYEFTHSERLPIDGSSDRRLPFWVKSSMQAGIKREPTVEMDRIPLYRNSILVQTQIDVGATRLDEKGVYEVVADE